MRRTAKFEKVSELQYISGRGADGPDTKAEYSDIKLPKRATAASAGYDFFAPYGFELKAGETIKVATGIKARMDGDFCLMIFPRSGLGFKYRLQLDNTVGIVDSDYYNNASNEGHIFIKITNDSKEDKKLTVEKGTAFAQGIFVPFGITEDDDAWELRNGGFGSTDPV